MTFILYQEMAQWGGYFYLFISKLSLMIKTIKAPLNKFRNINFRDWTF